MRKLNNDAYISYPINKIDMANVFGIGETVTNDEYKKMRKTNLNGLLNSYGDEADVFTEIIQNAFDTIQTGIQANKYTAENPPIIKIFIGRRVNDTPYFAVNDNGIGMEPDMVSKFTIPGYTKLKAKGKTLGYKGVGASFFFAASERISVQSIDVKGNTSSLTAKGSYSWIMNETAPEPVADEKIDFPQAVIENIKNEQGTTVCFYFHNGGKPKNLNNIVNQGASLIEESENWVSFLCSKTALGQVKDISAQNIKVTLYLDNGSNVTETNWTFKEYSKEKRTLGYPFPWLVFNIAKETSEIDVVAQKSPEQLIKFINYFQGVHARWSKEDIDKMNLTKDEDEIGLINNHLDFVDIFLCWSTDIMKEVDRRIGARKSQIRYGIKLVVDGIPQGRMMDFDTTSDIGLNRQAHMVVSFKELKMDDGRKIPSDEAIQEVIRIIGVRAMSIIEGYRKYLRKKGREPIAENLEKWKNDITERANGSLVRILFEKRNLTPPLIVDPSSENDVIALFSSLLSNNILKGYKLAALSGYARYDGLINIEKSDELKSTSDPFSYRDTDRIPGGKLQVVEFKHQFIDLISDFHKKLKFPNEINLVVCWSLPQVNQTMGEIEYCYETRKDHRPLYGITHIWTNESLTIPIISLHHFIAENLAILERAENNPTIGTAILGQLVQMDKDNSI